MLRPEAYTAHKHLPVDWPWTSRNPSPGIQTPGSRWEPYTSWRSSVTPRSGKTV